jgi:hypothetical protein
MKRWALAIVSVSVVLASATLAVAAIPSADGTITACRNAKSGALRVIDADAGQACSKDERQLSWNQTGPQGPPGTVSPITATQTFHYVPEPNPTTLFSETVSCPSGKHAVNGGILQTKADPSWPGDPGPNRRGGATVVESWELLEKPTDDLTVSYGASRPVDNGTGWRVTFRVVYPAATLDPDSGATVYPIDVTVYAVCL